MVSCLMPKKRLHETAGLEGELGASRRVLHCIPSVSETSVKTQRSLHQPPFPPFFFFCCCFFLAAGAPAGFWCRGGMMLLVEPGTAAALPGLGEVGGLFTGLLASLK